MVHSYEKCLHVVLLLHNLSTCTSISLRAQCSSDGERPLAVFSGDLPFNCSFEVDFCGMFQQTTTDDFDWTRQTGQTDTLGTGPNGTLFGEYYIYTEASNPRRENDRAV